MSKKKVIILIVIFILLILGVGFIVFSGVKSSEENEQVMSDIKESYKLLESNISSYNKVRSGLLGEISGYYSSDMGKYYDKFIKFLNDEGKLLEDIYVEVEKLDDFCLDRLFKNSEVNNICGNYKVYYETINNVYMNDINKVNEIINSYNQGYDKVLEVYSSKFASDYIDYNKDGVFLEREDM